MWEVAAGKLAELLKESGLELAPRCIESINDSALVFRIGGAEPRSLGGTLSIKYRRALHLGYDVRGLETFLTALDQTDQATVGIVRVPPEGPDYFTVVINDDASAVIAVLEAHGEK